MSFGKRTHEEPAQREAQRPLRKAPIEKAPGSATGILKLALGCIAGLGVIVFAASGFVTTMRGVERRLDESFNQIQIRPEVPLALLKTEAATGWSFGMCTLAQPETDDDGFLPGIAGRNGTMADRMRREMGGYQSDGLLDTANFLDCVARSESQTLCTPAVRKAFVADMTSFYRNHAVASPLIASGRGTGDDKFAEVIATLEAANLELSVNNASTNQQIAESKNVATSALETAAQAGYVSSWDFGLFAPSAVVNTLKDLKDPGKPCG